MYPPNAPEILKPASMKFIVFTLFAGLMLNLLPWTGWALTLRPDFVALVLLYWSIRQPRALGFGSAWLVGLMMDVADGILLGQHAFAYILTLFVALSLHRRIRRFGLWQQALHILLLLLLMQSVLLLVRLTAGPALWGADFFLSSLTGAAIWPFLNRTIQMPLPGASNPDAG